MKKILILIILGFNLASCQTKKETPKQYVSNVFVPKEMIKKDSLALTALIKDQIKNHLGDYFPKFYDDQTEIIMDTIMYNDKFDKLIFFIIDKVGNKKKYDKKMTKEQIKALENYGNLPYDGYHYNAHAYIAIKEKDILKINNFFRISIGDYKNINDLRNRQRQVFFQEYNAVKEKGYEYNLNDKRFWDNSNVWNKIAW